MIRKTLIGMVAGLFVLAFTLAPAGAQTDDDEAPAVDSAPVVLGETEVVPAPEVRGSQVQGSSLPVTGGELALYVVVGGALVGLGAALAMGARRKRAALEHA